MLKVYNMQPHIKLLGEHGGLVVEPRTPEREVGVRYLPPSCCVLEQRHINSPKNTGKTQEAVAPFTGTLSLNKTKISSF